MNPINNESKVYSYDKLNEREAPIEISWEEKTKLISGLIKESSKKGMPYLKTSLKSFTHQYVLTPAEIQEALKVVKTTLQSTNDGFESKEAKKQCIDLAILSLLEDCSDFKLIKDKDLIISYIVLRYIETNAFKIDDLKIKFGIEDPCSLIEIAKQCIEKCLQAKVTPEQRLNNLTEWVIKFVANFAITDQQTLKQIAKVLIVNYLPPNSTLIERFNITDIQAKLEIFRTSIKTWQDKACRNSFSFNKSVLEQIEIDWKEQWKNCDTSIFEQIKRESDSFILNKLICWIGYTLEILVINKANSVTLKALLDKNLLQEIVRYRKASLRYKLSNYMMLASTDTLVFNAFMSLDENCKIKPKGQPAATPIHTKLPNILLAQLLAKASTKEEKDIIILFSTYVQKNRELRDQKKRNILVETLELIFSQNNLNFEDKIHLLQQITPSFGKTFDFNLLSTIQGIVACKPQALIKKNVKYFQNDFKEIYSQIFNEVIPVGQIEGFADKYISHFGLHLRQSSALLVYAGGLQQRSPFISEVEQKSCLKSLGDYIRFVLNDEFISQRYSAPKDSHLATVFESQSGLKEAWMKNSKEPLSNFIAFNPLNAVEISKWQIVDTDDPYDLFLCTTEAKSCQAIDNFSMNYSLMAYPLDGKNRLIAIKDESGKIVARSILRLLWDQSDKKPVLLMEKVYPLNHSKTWEKSLEQMAKKKQNL